MASSHRRLLLLLGPVILLLGACRHEATSTETFKALRACAGSAITEEDEIAYCGPNRLPIGSVFERKGARTYDALWPGTLITGEAPPASLVSKNPAGSCSVQGKSSLDLKLVFGVSINPIPVSGELSNDLKMAKVVDMEAKEFAWDILWKGPYREAVRKLDPTGALYTDISSGNEIYATTALLKAKGYRTVLDVSAGNVSALKAKYKNGPLPKGLSGDVGAEVSVNWTDDDKMIIAVEEETYLGCIFRPFNKGVLQQAGEAEMLGQSPKNEVVIERLSVKFPR